MFEQPQRISPKGGPDGKPRPSLKEQVAEELHRQELMNPAEQTEERRSHLEALKRGKVTLTPEEEAAQKKREELAMRFRENQE